MVAHSGLAVAPVFMPVVGNFYKGLAVSVPLQLSQLAPGTSARALHEALAGYYAGEPFVRVMPLNDPDTIAAGGFDVQACNDTNRVDIFVFGGDEQALLIARLDNLGKGASGAAVQCMNVHLGVEETMGLEAIRLAAHSLTHVLHAIGGSLSVYLLGWVVGSLLVDSRTVTAEAAQGEMSPARDLTLPWALVRLLAGLLLSALVFLLSLVLGLPWFVGPATAVGAAVASHRRLAFAVPRPNVGFTSHGVAALLLAVVLQAPIFISALRMAPGPFPPVFFHVDTPYSLEKVQSLTKTRVYPPGVTEQRWRPATVPLRGASGWPRFSRGPPVWRPTTHCFSSCCRSWPRAALRLPSWWRDRSDQQWRPSSPCRSCCSACHPPGIRSGTWWARSSRKRGPRVRWDRSTR